MDLLAALNRDYAKTLILSLHQVDYARSYCQRVLALKAGALYHDGVIIDLNVRFLKEPSFFQRLNDTLQIRISIEPITRASLE